MASGNSSVLLEEGEPAADPRAFRRCLGQFATGVTVMTTQVDGRCVGLTANSFSSLSLDPPLILWSIDRRARSLPAFENASHFAVNILAEDQAGISQVFASSGVEKFAHCSWSHGLHGVPLIDGVVARFECRREVLYDGGDHVILVGRVERFARFAGEGLLFVQGRYGVADDHPDSKGTGSPSEALESAPAGDALTLPSLLFRAHHLAAAEIERHRRDANLTIPQARVLYLLAEHSELSMQALTQGIFLPEPVVEDAVSDMIAQGQVMRDIAGLIRLTPAGCEHWLEVRQRSAMYNKRQLAGITEAEMEAGRQFLLKFIERLEATADDRPG